MLAAIGMEAFAERARRELLVTGETARKRTVETAEELTAQESQIAQYARDGLSNQEIGTLLFISPRTVEWHLHNVFTKLGIRSRVSCATSLAAPRCHVVIESARRGSFHSGRMKWQCTQRGTSRGSPGARARPPRRGRPA